MTKRTYALRDIYNKQKMPLDVIEHYKTMLHEKFSAYLIDNFLLYRQNEKIEIVFTATEHKFELEPGLKDPSLIVYEIRAELDDKK